MDEKPKLIEKPGYYAIIPANVRYDKRLSDKAKLLYGEITCLLQFNNKCFATNFYFSRLYEVTETQISRLISQLVNTGYIETNIEIKPNGSSRLISLPHNINVNPPVNKNIKGGINKNVKYIIHSITILSLSKDKENAPFIDFWNIYNNKKGLKEAFKNWSKLDSETHNIILLKLRSWLVQNAESFLPHPATWLNQERWNDEISTPSEQLASVVPEIYAHPINHDDRA